jgi:hypothetical protein
MPDPSIPIGAVMGPVGGLINKFTSSKIPFNLFNNNKVIPLTIIDRI